MPVTRIVRLQISISERRISMLSSTLWRLLRSLIFSFFLALLLLIGLTFLLYKFRLGESQITAGICGIYILTCLFGGFLSGKSIKTYRFFWGLLTGILYFICLLLTSALQDSGITSNLSHLLFIGGICAGSGMVGGMIS